MIGQFFKIKEHNKTKKREVVIYALKNAIAAAIVVLVSMFLLLLYIGSFPTGWALGLSLLWAVVAFIYILVVIANAYMKRKKLEEIKATQEERKQKQ